MPTESTDTRKAAPGPSQLSRRHPQQQQPSGVPREATAEPTQSLLDQQGPGPHRLLPQAGTAEKQGAVMSTHITSTVPSRPKPAIASIASFFGLVFFTTWIVWVPRALESQGLSPVAWWTFEGSSMPSRRLRLRRLSHYCWSL